MMIALTGCSALPTGQSNGDGPSVSDEQVTVEDRSAGATGVNQTLRITADETAAGSELSAIGATYPRDNFTVGSAQHEAISIGVDTDGDGELDRTFNETHISGVNNNEYSFDVTLDTGSTLEAGDTVVVRYPATDNPSEAGDYEVEVRLNDQQTETAAVTIE
jgi:hypothetical protein